MPSYAAFRRSFKVGTVFHCDHHERPEITGERTVTKVQTNAIAYPFEQRSGTMGTGWTHWPSAKQVRMNEDGSCTFLRNGEPAFTYSVKGGE